MSLKHFTLHVKCDRRGPNDVVAFFSVGVKLPVIHFIVFIFWIKKLNLDPECCASNWKVAGYPFTYQRSKCPLGCVGPSPARNDII